MKIDYDYIKKLLEACQASDKPTFDIEDLKVAGFNYNDPKFEFHMAILNDRGFIEQEYLLNLVQARIFPVGSF